MFTWLCQTAACETDFHKEKEPVLYFEGRNEGSIFFGVSSSQVSPSIAGLVDSKAGTWC